MIENAMRNFSEMALLGELIEHAIKTKKLEVLEPSIGIALVKRKDEETQAIFSNQQHMGHAPYLAYPNHHPYYPTI